MSVSENQYFLININIECLKTNPDERPNIDQVIENKWIAVSSGADVIIFIQPDIVCSQQYDVVPATPLVTSDVLREETEGWMEVKQGMALALQEMRVEKVRYFSTRSKITTRVVRFFH